MSKTLFDVVIICIQKEEKYFVGKIPSFSKLTGSALAHNFLNYKKKDGNTCYVKFNENAFENGWLKSINVNRMTTKCSKDDADKRIYAIQQKIIEKHGEDSILNDIIICPTKYKCECGHEVRLQFKKEHEENYCLAKKLCFEEILADLN